MTVLTLLKIEEGFIIYRDDELVSFISYPNHYTILNRIGLDIRIREGKKLLELVKGKYNLRIVKSLLIR